jgi:hypothetical protein
MHQCLPHDRIRIWYVKLQRSRDSQRVVKTNDRTHRCNPPDAELPSVRSFPERAHHTKIPTRHVRSTLTWHAPVSGHLSSSLCARAMMMSAYVIVCRTWALHVRSTASTRHQQVTWRVGQARQRLINLLRSRPATRRGKELTWRWCQRPVVTGSASGHYLSPPFFSKYATALSLLPTC